MLSHHHTIIALAFALVTTTTLAQEFIAELPVPCMPAQELFQQLERDFGETVTWQGAHAADNSVYIMFESTVKRTWTLIKSSPTTACVLGAGETVTTPATPI